MKVPTRVKIALASLLFVGGVVSGVVAFRPADKPQEVTVKQVAATQLVAKENPVPDVISAPAAETQNQATQQPAPAQSTATESGQEPVVMMTDDNATVASIERIDVGRGWEECQLNFSDGSIYRRSWKMVRNGVTEYEGKCDDTLVGTLKSVN